MQTVAKTPPSCRSKIFRHGHRIDIADTTAFEMAWTRMMDGMSTPPRLARCKREYADYATNPVISWWAMAEERTVTAINAGSSRDWRN